MTCQYCGKGTGPAPHDNCVFERGERFENYICIWCNKENCAALSGGNCTGGKFIGYGESEEEDD